MNKNNYTESYSITIIMLLAARTFLAIQNFCVSLCALGMSSFLWMYENQLCTSNDESTTIDNINNGILGKEQNNFDLDDAGLKNNLENVYYWPSLETAKIATIVGVITFSSVARLASSGTVIILQKDWIVVIADNDTDYLASRLK